MTSIILKAIDKKIIHKRETLELINQLIEKEYYISPQVYLKIIDSLKQ